MQKKVMLIAVVALIAAAAIMVLIRNNKSSKVADQPIIVEQEPATHVEVPTIVPPAPVAQVPAGSSNSPQFVVLAFDGSYSLSKWQQTLDFAKEMNASGEPIHFTYFLSGVYFLENRYKTEYLTPNKPAGTSLIGFAINDQDIKQRVAYVNRAIAEGHDIGSHLNGHFNGSTWTAENWQQEFDQFDKLIFSIAQNNQITANPQDYQINLSKSDLVGLRAPNLGTNKDLWPVSKAHGFLYDTSLVGKASAWPAKLSDGTWEFPLAAIKYADQNSSILSMDYNFYFKQSKGVDVAKKGSPEWQKFYDDTYLSYINYFNNNYKGNHAPVYIGSHFSDWNDGVYWEAMRDFAKTVCGKPQVQCVSFKELMNYLNTNE